MDSSPAKSRLHFYLDQPLSMVCCAVNTKLAEPLMHLCMIAISGVHRTCCDINVTAFIQNVIVHLTTFKRPFPHSSRIILHIYLVTSPNHQTCPHCAVSYTPAREIFNFLYERNNVSE